MSYTYTSDPSSSAQNQQHPFLFHPQKPQYSSGDDGDSPPSLTNSSESPRSTSEEGESSLARFDSFDQGHTKEIMSGNPKIEEDMLMSPILAVTPNWDSVFASGLGTDEMDLSASLGDVGESQWKSMPEMAVAPNLNVGTATASSTGGQEDIWSCNNLPQDFQSWSSNGVDSKTNDEAMFDSLIQEDSFEQSNRSTLADQSTETKGLLSINTMPSSLPAPSEPNSMTSASASASASASNNTPPQSAKISTSALSSRRNSIDYQPKPKVTKIPHCGSHYSHTSDADLSTSSSVVVRPSRSELKGLQVHVHGIAFTGAKSRVETQIRTRIELVRPVNVEVKDGLGDFERIGTFTHVKLPPLTGTKRKSKKPKPTDIAPEKTLFMDATVVRATAPHDRVLVCPSCQQRERKRAQRKRTSTPKKEEKQEEEEEYSLDELVEYGIDPEAPNAQEQARSRAVQEDEKRVVVFNCGDFIDFEEGACVLPTRITCYCRHHKEKTGFCLIFTMRDFRGNLIATGSTPPIMITDDHKSVAAAQAAGATTPSTNSKRSEGARSRGTSVEALDESTLRSINREAAKKKRTHRARPYGDADDRASRRNTLSSSNSMTPFTSTGQNTPAAGQSPPSLSDMNQPEFWHAFASMSTIANNSTGPQSSLGAQTPHESLSPIQQLSPAQQPINPTNSNEWLANFGNQGSLSSQTLHLSPQSLPGFDLNAFSRSLQQSSQQAGDEATMQQLLILARSLPGMGQTPNLNVDSNPRSGVPVPSISKLIPGEGPTSGGIEVTVLGENFTENLTCLFGDVPAISTRVWGSNTLLCILPPSASPGPVAVSIKPTHGEVNSRNDQEGMARSLQLFTYIDTTDRALMELALQVVGLQMTGQMQTARDVAMRVVGSGSNQGITRSNESTPQQTTGNQQMRSAVPGLFAGGLGNQSFQNSVLQFLTTLDEPVGEQRRDAIRLANKQGHTLLHLTVILGFHRLALDLIQRGCPINARDNNGYTPLHFAALHERMTIARLLLANGARMDVECDAGRYPIDVAREREQVDVELLMEDFMGEEDSDSDSESDWTTDDEDEKVDADIVSIPVDGENSRSIEVESVGKEDKKLEEVASSHALLDEKKNLDANDRSQDNEKKSFEAIFGLKGLVSGGMDLAQKWPNAAIGKIGMPMALHDRLQSMQMPTVSVFQMVMPPNFMNWNGATNNEETRSAEDKGKAREQNSEESSRTLTMWRNIFEESALWINPLYSPPPTYESSILPSKDKINTNESTSDARGSSRFPAIAQASPDSPHKDNEVRQRKATISDMNMRSVSWHPDHQSNTITPPIKSQSSSALPTRSRNLATKNNNPSRSFKDDPMLVYFWLPSLVFVILLLCFASPSSVLSYKDLVSYMPV